MRPRVDQLPRRVVGNDLLGGAATKDALGESAQTVGGLGVIRAPAGEDEAFVVALGLFVPNALDDLEVAEEGAVGSTLAGHT